MKKILFVNGYTIMKRLNAFSKMAKYLPLMALCLAPTFFTGCASMRLPKLFPRPAEAETGPETAGFDGGTLSGQGISAQGGLGGVAGAPQGPLYSLEGGRDIRLAVLAPEIQGAVPDYLPVYIQGLLNNNFNRYSAISLIDRQNLDRIIDEQDIAASGRFSDRDFITIGNMTNAQYFLFSTIQRLSGERYALQLSITESATAVRRANFMRDGPLALLESGMLINEATADLLTQMGVVLTETGRRMLLEGNSSVARAEAGLARGITAQTGGDDVEALLNITQAITFDPSNLEALSRLNMLSSGISGGNISQRIVGDIQNRSRWLEVFRETARFFNDHPPFEITFDPNLVQIGQIDYQKNLATIGMHVALDPSEAGFGAINTLLDGLEKTGKRGEWGFSGWPLLDITPRTPGTVVLNGRTSFSFKVDVAIKNENNKTLSSNSITLSTESIRFSAGDVKVQPPAGGMGTVVFPNVKAEDLTPSLTILIVAVNGISSRDLSATGYIRVDTGDLEKRAQESGEAARMAQAQRDREAAALKAERQQKAAIRQAQAKQKFSGWSRLVFKSGGLGLNYVTDNMVGAGLGVFGIYGSFSASMPYIKELFSDEHRDDRDDRAAFEVTIGPSFPTVKNLRITLGAGARWTENDDTKYKRNSYIFEPGLRLFLGNMFYVSAAYRLRFGDYDGSAFNLGAGLGGYSD